MVISISRLIIIESYTTHEYVHLPYSVKGRASKLSEIEDMTTNIYHYYFSLYICI